MYVDSQSKSAINNRNLLNPNLADGELEVNLDGTDVGVVISGMLEPWEGTRLGVAYRNETNPNLSGNPRFRNLAPWLTQALDSAGVLNSKLDLDLNVPQTLQTGFYHQLDERLVVMGDFTWMDWSRFGRVDVTVSSTSITAVQRYKDIYIGSFGVDCVLREDLSAGAGFSYVSPAVNTRNRTLALPFDEIFLFGIGGRYRARPNLEIHSNLLAAISGSGRIDQNSNSRAGRVRGKSDDNWSLIFQLSFVWGTEPI